MGARKPLRDIRLGARITHKGKTGILHENAGDLMIGSRELSIKESDRNKMERFSWAVKLNPETDAEVHDGSPIEYDQIKPGMKGEFVVHALELNMLEGSARKMDLTDALLKGLIKKSVESGITIQQLKDEHEEYRKLEDVITKTGIIKSFNKETGIIEMHNGLGAIQKYLLDPINTHSKWS